MTTTTRSRIILGLLIAVVLLGAYLIVANRSATAEPESSTESGFVH